jgi:hypothetical protein
MPVWPKFEPTIIMPQVSSLKWILVSATAAEPAESEEAADERFRHEGTADPHDRLGDRVIVRVVCVGRLLPRKGDRTHSTLARRGLTAICSRLVGPPPARRGVAVRIDNRTLQRLDD